jgi:hypothetical protein
VQDAHIDISLHFCIIQRPRDQTGTTLETPRAHFPDYHHNPIILQVELVSFPSLDLRRLMETSLPSTLCPLILSTLSNPASHMGYRCYYLLCYNKLCALGPPQGSQREDLIRCCGTVDHTHKRNYASLDVSFGFNSFEIPGTSLITADRDRFNAV